MEKRRVLFGTSGWSYEDWKGVFYPEKGRVDTLRFAAEYFDALEINSTFYRPASVKTAESWARRTADLEGFEFTAKLWERFTHRRGAKWTQAEAGAVKRGMDVLAEAGKLAGVLAQFPWSFKNTAENRGWLEAVVEEFREYQLFVEVRHSSWATDEVFSYLDAAGVGFVDVDQPLFGGSLAPTERVTGGKGYVRLHGRNKEKWFADDVGRDARYDYLYKEDELKEWAERIGRLAREAEKVFVFSNNHYRGQAAVNSLELKSLVTGCEVSAPERLVRAYARLGRVARRGKERGGGEERQGRLL